MAWTVLRLAAAAAEPALAPPVTSSNGRFRAAGPVPEHNLEVVSWADRFVGHLEETVGLPMPWSGAEALFFQLQPAVTGQPARVSVRATPGGIFSAEISIVDFSRLDEEDLMEAFAALLLQRMAGAPAALPAWYTVGVAQLAEPSTRERDLARVLDRWRRQQEDRVREVLTWEALPPGRYGSKASAAAVVAWLGDQPDASTRQARLFALWRSGGRLTPAGLAALLPDTQDAIDLEKSFDLWMLRRSEDPAFAGWSAHILGRLRDTLRAPPLLLRHASDTQRELPGLEQFPDWAHEPWMRAAMTDQRRRLGLLLTGQPPEFIEAVRAYQAYLDAVLEAVPPRVGAEPAPVTPKTRAGLVQALNRARALQAAFEQRTALRLAWLDEVERKLDPPPPPRAVAEPGARSALQRYLDAFDDERKPGAGQP